MQRRIDALLDEADACVSAGEWQQVAEKATAVLSIDSDNDDAAGFLTMAEAALARVSGIPAPPDQSRTETDEPDAKVSGAVPDSFAGGRYHVRRFLGEGGKKRVFLAHDELLDRDIAFSLIKTEGLDDTGRERIMREARAMGRLSHQNIVAIYDIGEHTAADGSKQPYLVQELMGGGDVEGLLEDADGALPLRQSLDIALETARGLEFAHAQGVIHRDLKPGNVWLTADGVAKIGDLGLAVTMGQSRLTSHGMMVGTYGYMPPEQALGQEVTPQADLYSLGAMLYEMVTGRAPFEGDMPTAVISQHLNTRPVAPSWHTEHCPPELESLILRLLEKEPGKRPASAAEVLVALDHVDADARSVSHSDSQTNPLDRLARGVFVGRDKELEQLHEALNSALDGRGSVVMLVGEPGIGKTRTVQELETYARMRGAEVFWGRTHESSGMPAYWPWVQIGRAWGAGRDFSQLTNQAGTLNPELFRLFPELQQTAPAFAALAPSEHQEPAAAQFLLFDAYTQFIRAQAQQSPWVVVLDDLHWSDKPTLQLLQYLARELANMPVLVIGTYRDTDLVRTHPLSEVLAELNRESGFLRINLRGLDRDEVATYVRRQTASEVPESLLDRVYEETEGNPFFLSEVVNLMTEEGTIAGESVSDVALPEGVREALGRRLDRLSEEANELLSYGAVAGREFSYDTLLRLLKSDDDALLRLIEEGLAARVIEETERPGRYRFTHALMQETLLDELSTTRRVRMHGQIANIIEERYGDRAVDQAARLAMHFSESATLTDEHSGKAVRYSELAAQQADGQAAWVEAARHYTNALTYLPDDVEGSRRAGLLIAQGRCLVSNSEFRPAWRALMEARSIAQKLDLAGELIEATLQAVRIQSPGARVLPMFDEALNALSPGNDQLEFRLLVELLDWAQRFGWNDRIESARGRLTELAELESVPPTLVAEWEARELRADLSTSNDLEALRRRAGALQPRLPLSGGLTTVPFVIPSTYAREGRVTAVQDSLKQALDAFRRAHLRLYEQNILIALAATSSITGDPERARHYLDEMTGENMWREVLLIRMATEAGDQNLARQLLPSVEAAGGFAVHVALVHALRSRVAFESGQTAEAREWFDQMMEALEPTRHAIAERRRVLALAEVDVALTVLPDEEQAEAMLAELTRVEPDRMHFSTGRNLDLTRAFLSSRLGRLDETEQHLRAGIAWCEREHCQVDAARCYQALADVAERRGDVEEARAHLDIAGELFAAHGATFYLDQVIAKKEILKA